MIVLWFINIKIKDKAMSKNDKELIKKGKYLSFLLRHDTEYTFDKNGYREVSDLIKNHGYTRSELEEIVGVRWDSFLCDMIYTAKSGAERSLNPKDKIINKIDFTEGHYDNEVELILAENQEAIIENGKVKVIKKLYPYTFKECCEIMGVHVSGELLYDSDEDLTPYENSLVDGLDALRKLIICRDAYWKCSDITLEDIPVLYAICWDSIADKMIKKTYHEPLNKLLAFPKEDMRDIFARKFEDLIEKCKYFL